MGPEGFAATVAVVTFGGGLIGLALQQFLPDEHTAGPARDMIGAVVGLLTLLCALVAGLLIWTAYGVYAGQNAAIQNLAAKVVQLNLARGLWAGCEPGALRAKDICNLDWPMLRGPTSPGRAPFSDRPSMAGAALVPFLGRAADEWPPRNYSPRSWRRSPLRPKPGRSFLLGDPARLSAPGSHPAHSPRARFSCTTFAARFWMAAFWPA